MNEAQRKQIEDAARAYSENGLIGDWSMNGNFIAGAEFGLKLCDPSAYLIQLQSENAALKRDLEKCEGYKDLYEAEQRRADRASDKLVIANEECDRYKAAIEKIYKRCIEDQRKANGSCAMIAGAALNVRPGGNDV